MKKKKIKWFDFSDTSVLSLKRNPQEIADAYFKEVYQTSISSPESSIKEICACMKISQSNFFYQAKRLGIKLKGKKGRRKNERSKSEKKES